jgi:dephospho-CoA kinase
MGLIGLTGNIASGKSTVAMLLETHPGIVVFDADALAKQIITDPVERSAVADILGPNVLSPDGIDLGMVATIVFQDAEKRRRLEQHVHPVVWDKITEQVGSLLPHQIPILESAILYEIGWEDRFECMIVVSCTTKERVRRLRKIRRMTDAEISLRMSLQLSEEEKSARADILIRTDCPVEELEPRISGLYRKLLALSGHKI